MTAEMPMIDQVLLYVPGNVRLITLAEIQREIRRLPPKSL